MSKKVIKTSRKHDTGVTITTKSPFGSHKNMVLDSAQYTSKGPIDGVVLQDDRGLYITDENLLDIGLADPNRYCEEKRIKDIEKYGLKLVE